MATAMAKTLVALLLYVVCASAAVSEAQYAPSARVKEYHTYNFPASYDYFLKIVSNRIVPIIIVGVVLFFFLFFWSCGRCCCTKACKAKSAEEASGIYQAVLITIIVALSLACIGMLIYGLYADSKQSQALNDIPELIDNFITYVSNTVSMTQTIVNTAATTISTSQKIVNSSICSDSFKQYFNCSSVKSVINEASTVTSNANGIADALNNIVPQLTRTRNSVQDQITPVNNMRHTVMVALLASLFALIIIQGLIALANLFLPTEYQPRKTCICKPTIVMISMLVVILLLLIWVVSAFFLGLATVDADFCINPIGNLINQYHITDKYVLYYLTCAMNTSQTNPLQTYVNGVTSGFDYVNKYFKIANDSFTNCSHINSTVCNMNISNDLSTINGYINTIFINVGVSTNSGASGLLGQVSCAQVNGLVQATLNVICGDLFDTLAATFEVLMVFACFLFIIEVSRRLMPVRRDDTVEPIPATIFGYDPAQMPMSEVSSNTSSSHLVAPPRYTETINPAYVNTDGRKPSIDVQGLQPQ